MLGVVIPAIVSLGTAAFGISVAREESKKRGEAEQKQEHAEREKGEADDALNRAEQKNVRIDRDRGKLADGLDALAPLVEWVNKNGTSAAGTDGIELKALAGDLDLDAVQDKPIEEVMPPIESIEVSGEEFAQAEAALRLASEIKK